MQEIIYILTNESMPGLIKIGKTTTSVEQRMRELDTSGVALPFQCFYAALVEEGKSNFIERQIHYIFGEQRVRNNREFFQIDPNRVKAAIDLIAIREVTPQIKNILETSDSEALSKNERRRPFRFSLASIPIGATLTFSRDESITCQVVDDKNIIYEGQKTSLSAVASKILNEKMGWTASQVQGPLFWMYEDETLEERRQRIEIEA